MTSTAAERRCARCGEHQPSWLVVLPHSPRTAAGRLLLYCERCRLATREQTSIVIPLNVVDSDPESVLPALYDSRLVATEPEAVADMLGSSTSAGWVQSAEALLYGREGLPWLGRLAAHSPEWNYIAQAPHSYPKFGHRTLRVAHFFLDLGARVEPLIDGAGSLRMTYGDSVFTAFVNDWGRQDDWWWARLEQVIGPFPDDLHTLAVIGEFEVHGPHEHGIERRGTELFVHVRVRLGNPELALLDLVNVANGLTHALRESAPDEQTPEKVPTWNGVLDPDQLSPEEVRVRSQLADAAKEGRWDDLLEILRAPGHEALVNSWRPGGESWYTALHQAAWHGAPATVVQELLRLGAWKSIRTSSGQRAVDIAADKGHHHLLALLANDLDFKDHEHLTRQLGALVDSVRPNGHLPLRHPPTEVIYETPCSEVWYPIPGMYGGFRIRGREKHLYVQSWSRVIGGSGKAHVVTPQGAYLVDSGFV